MRKCIFQVDKRAFEKGIYKKQSATLMLHHIIMTWWLLTTSSFRVVEPLLWAKHRWQRKNNSNNGATLIITMIMISWCRLHRCSSCDIFVVVWLVLQRGEMKKVNESNNFVFIADTLHQAEWQRVTKRS